MAQPEGEEGARSERGSRQPQSKLSALQAELVPLKSKSFAEKQQKKQIEYCGCDCCMGVKNGERL